MSDDGEFFTLAELAGRLGALVWIEERLAEIVGGWAATETHHRAKIAFAEMSRHHAWHAELLRGVLPTSEQLAAVDAVAAPTTGWADAVDKLGAMSGVEARLLALVRVVDPWVADETGVLLDLANPVSDRAVSRLLEFVEIDHYRDGEQVAELLELTRTNTANFDDHRAVTALDLT